MKDLNNWKEITKGLYRYVIGCNVCYEIHIMNWFTDTDILAAKAKLYIVGEWKNNIHNGAAFEREFLIENTVQECIEYAYKDNQENNS